MIYLGSEHGDDRCPLDLDALLVWFGALGMAVLVMDCANDGPFALLEWNDYQMRCPLWCSALLVGCCWLDFRHFSSLGFHSVYHINPSESCIAHGPKLLELFRNRKKDDQIKDVVIPDDGPAIGQRFSELSYKSSGNVTPCHSLWQCWIRCRWLLL